MKKKSYKKYFNATLASAVVASGAVVATPTAEAASFPDVKSSDYFYEAVKSLSDRGVIKGFPDGTFKPYQNVTRGQAAKIIAGVLGLDTVNVKNPGFSDVPTTNEYYGAIAALANAGIINGYPNGTFKPNAPVQRNHMAKIIATAFNLEPSSNVTTPFTDLNIKEYDGYIKALYELGITTGNTPTTFGGTSNVTRGQLATFVVRAENVQVETASEVSITISDISGNTITAGNETYEVSSALQGLFNASNKAALKGAVVKAKVVNGKITSITSLELNAAGKAGAFVTLDGKNANIAGDLKVNADFVAVKNLKVDGNITLTNKVSKEFSASGVTAKGELIIAAAKNEVASLTPIAAELTGPKVNLENVTITKVEVQRDGVAIASNSKLPEVVVTASVSTIQIDADVTKVLVDVDVKITVTGTGNIDEVAIQKAVELALQVAGEVAKLSVNNENAKVEVGTNVKIQTVVVPEGKTANSVITNYNSVRSNIDKVEDSKGNSVSTGSSSGGGGGSSSSGSSGSGGSDSGTGGNQGGDSGTGEDPGDEDQKPDDGDEEPNEPIDKDGVPSAAEEDALLIKSSNPYDKKLTSGDSIIIKFNTEIVNDSNLRENIRSTMEETFNYANFYIQITSDDNQTIKITLTKGTVLDLTGEPKYLVFKPGTIKSKDGKVNDKEIKFGPIIEGSGTNDDKEEPTTTPDTINLKGALITPGDKLLHLEFPKGTLDSLTTIDSIEIEYTSENTTKVVESYSVELSEINIIVTDFETPLDKTNAIRRISLKLENGEEIVWNIDNVKFNNSPVFSPNFGPNQTIQITSGDVTTVDVSEIYIDADGDPLSIFELVEKDEKDVIEIDKISPGKFVIRAKGNGNAEINLRVSDDDSGLSYTHIITVNVEETPQKK